MARYGGGSLVLAVFVILGPRASPAAAADPLDRSRLEKEIESLRSELGKKEALFLKPSDEDRRAWASYLRQPDTGLVRLLPRERYQRKLTLRGDGAYYSFARLTHEYGLGSDISLQQGALTVGFAGYQLGFLVRLGEVPLERATLDSPGVPFLAAWPPPRTDTEIRAEQWRSEAGIEHQGFAYRRRVAAERDATYALRSIDYGRSDVLVVFRVLRQDGDGSLILLWHKLKDLPVPRPPAVPSGAADAP